MSFSENLYKLMYKRLRFECINPGSSSLNERSYYIHSRLGIYGIHLDIIVSYPLLRSAFARVRDTRDRYLLDSVVAYLVKHD